MRTIPSPSRHEPAAAADVAEYLLHIGGAMESEKLHALLYLAQGHHLAITGRPLFESPILAAEDGPVVAEIQELLAGETEISPGFFQDKLRQLEHSPTDAAAAVALAENAGDFQAHVYDGGRCVFCGTNDLDDGLYGPFECVRRGQFVFTTETPASSNDV